MSFMFFTLQHDICSNVTKRADDRDEQDTVTPCYLQVRCSGGELPDWRSCPALCGQGAGSFAECPLLVGTDAGFTLSMLIVCRVNRPPPSNSSPA